MAATSSLRSSVLIDEKVRELTLTPAKNNPKFKEEFEAIFPLTEAQFNEFANEKKDKTRYEKAKKAVDKLYAKKEKELDTEIIRKVERDIYIQVLDTLWMQHLENMQHLRDGIHWRSVGQRDPLVEYRSESQKLFDGLQATLRDEVLRTVMHVHKHDAVASEDEEHETELTRLAERAVEQGVNEIGSGEANRDNDFKVTKVKTQDANRVKNQARKKKKVQRQNRKKSRR
jgi:preprotein translocase subunit SecA